MSRSRLLSLLLALLVPASAMTAPVPEDQQIPVDFRRTTLIVRDIEASLALYRDALGMKLIYDQELAPDEEGKPTARLVLLRANDDFIGWLGLYRRYRDPEVPPPSFERPLAGQPILVFNAKDLEERFAKIRAVPGVKVVTEPEIRRYPRGDGGEIEVLFSAIFDPDGFFVEINELHGPPAGR
ncbi:MAG: hypothetical protein KatS3mg125_0206 [Lysobacterales bacterium]|jgi:catechol 2,3-dioxygenase-like lactoylglutathione lyase family enzyme|nr:MAG: hypothetical protein KatS3mg125_0206 [Xanthomonadales bacterium]